MTAYILFDLDRRNAARAAMKLSGILRLLISIS